MKAPIKFEKLIGAKVTFSGHGPTGYHVEILTQDDQSLGRLFSISIICSGKVKFEKITGTSDGDFRVMCKMLEGGGVKGDNPKNGSAMHPTKMSGLMVSGANFSEDYQAIELALDDTVEVCLSPTAPLGDDSEEHTVLYDYRPNDVFDVYIIGTDGTEVTRQDWSLVASNCGMKITDKKFLKMMGRS